MFKCLWSERRLSTLHFTIPNSSGRTQWEAAVINQCAGLLNIPTLAPITPGCGNDAAARRFSLSDYFSAALRFLESALLNIQAEKLC
jgi:hypothetical protein